MQLSAKVMTQANAHSLGGHQRAVIIPPYVHLADCPKITGQHIPGDGGRVESLQAGHDLGYDTCSVCGLEALMRTLEEKEAALNESVRYAG